MTVHVRRSRPGGCPGERQGQRCGFQRPLPTETWTWAHAEGERRERDWEDVWSSCPPRLGENIVGFGGWSDPKVFFFPSIFGVSGQDLKGPALCCSKNLVAGEGGVATLKRKEKDGAEHPGSPAGP